jgi:DNA polymerase I-like protein with 3'-5' exonuclease and polymerase domains
MEGKKLPSKWKGNYLDIATLSDEDREKYGLSWSGSIIEVVGSPENRFGLDHAVQAIKYARAQGIATLDLETDGSEEYAEDDDKAGLDPYKAQIVLCQIGDMDKQYLFWWSTISDETKEVIREWWSDRESRTAGVNLKFDARMLLAQEGLHWRGERILDAQLLEQILGCGLLGGDIGLTMKLTGMGAMAKRWLGWLLPKDEDIRTGWGAMTPGKWHRTKEEWNAAVRVGAESRTWEEVKADGLRKRYYAADDCVVPILLIQKQAPWIQELKLIDTVKLEMDFLPVLAEMEVRGLPIKWEDWKQLSDEAAEALKKAEKELDTLFEVTARHEVDLAGNVVVSRDKNYGSKDELKELIRVWMYREYGVEVVGNNRQFKEAALRGGLNPMRAEKLFEQKLQPSKEDSAKNKQVGYPNMTDYIDGSEYVKSLWSQMKRYLPENSFAMTTTESPYMKLLRILHETPNDLIDDLPSIPTKVGLPPQLVGPILAHREAGTKLQRYAYSWEKIINPVTGRVHTSHSQTAADTGRLSSSPNCFDGSTEVLTPRGWVQFPDLLPEDHVAQFDATTGVISFVLPEARVEYPYVGNMLHVSNDQIELLMTPEHRLLWETRKGKREFVPAASWVPDRKIFHAGTFVGGECMLSVDEVRFLVAVQADAHLTPYRVDFGFTKERKATRLREILTALGIPVVESRSGTRIRMILKRADTDHLLSYLGPDKQFGWWVLDLSTAALQAFTDEVWQWDGYNAKRTHYASNERQNADIVQAAVLLSGRRATTRPYAAASGNTNWQVDASSKDYSWTTNTAPVEEEYSGMVYCVTVPTGAIVVRRKAQDGRYRATVVGNCQNLPADPVVGPRYRAAACTARPGYKIVGADFSQIEPRIIGEISLCETYMRIFWSEKPGTAGFAHWCGPDVTEPLDLYGGVGARIGVMPKEGEKKSVAKDKTNKEISKGRKKAKIAVLGLGYGTGKEKFHISYVLDTGEYHSREDADKLFDGFWDAAQEVKVSLDALSDLAYPGDDEWRGETQTKVKSKRATYHPFKEERVTWSESLGGRKRFFDRSSPQWWTQGRNHPVQSTGADILKETCVVLGHWMWNEKIDGFMILTAHDELVAEVREDQADMVANKMEEVMAQVGERYTPHVPITAEAYVADFWVKD